MGPNRKLIRVGFGIITIIANTKQRENELKSSKQELEDHLGITVHAFCFPSGQYNDTTLQLMPKLGYKMGSRRNRVRCI